MRTLKFTITTALALGGIFAAYTNMSNAPLKFTLDNVKTALPAMGGVLQGLPGGGTKHPTKRTDLWSCTCSNMHNADSCSKGYAFNSMTAAAHYAKSKCGEDCTLNCNPKQDESFVEREKNPDDPDDIM